MVGIIFWRKGDKFVFPTHIFKFCHIVGGFDWFENCLAPNYLLCMIAIIISRNRHKLQILKHVDYDKLYKNSCATLFTKHIGNNTLKNSFFYKLILVYQHTFKI